MPQAAAFGQWLTQPPPPPHHCQLRCRSAPPFLQVWHPSSAGTAAAFLYFPGQMRRDVTSARRMLPSWVVLCAKVCLRVAAQVLWWEEWKFKHSLKSQFKSMKSQLPCMSKRRNETKTPQKNPVLWALASSSFAFSIAYIPSPSQNTTFLPSQFLPWHSRQMTLVRKSQSLLSHLWLPKWVGLWMISCRQGGWAVPASLGTRVRAGLGSSAHGEDLDPQVELGILEPVRQSPDNSMGDAFGSLQAELHFTLVELQ